MSLPVEENEIIGLAAADASEKPWLPSRGLLPVAISRSFTGLKAGRTLTPWARRCE